MLAKYLQLIIDSYVGMFWYIIDSITRLHSHNYFYWLILISLICWGLEVVFPWRKNQAIFRKDFWLDTFYMFFNFFLFYLIGYNAISNVGIELYKDSLNALQLNDIVIVNVEHLPLWSRLTIMFIVADFIQWNVHRLLHHSPFLWKFHKLHHSVKEMGFAAHLRFHWMESFLYKSIQFIPLAMIGFGIDDFLIVHLITITIGHLNHSNLNWDYGPLKYVFNNPKMHIWHHAKVLPDGSKGVNFGLSLSMWDYLFKTAHVPSSGRDIELGFDGDEKYPDSFGKQMVRPFEKE